MTWVRLSDTFAENPRWDDLGAECLALHVGALCFSSRHRTDGVIARARAERLFAVGDPVRVVDALIAAEFWVVDGDDIRIVGYTDDQMSKEDVEKAEAFAKIRQRRQRQHNAGDHSLCSVKYCHILKAVTRDTTRDATRDNTGDERHPNPTHPDPTEGKGREGRSASGARLGARFDASAQGEAHPVPNSSGHIGGEVDVIDTVEDNDDEEVEQ